LALLSNFRLLQQIPPALGRKITLAYGLLIGANLAVWLWALLAFRDHPVLLGSALLAYGFGLRHAVDADHIAAIDNVTRKLMQDGQRPVAVGFFFALGHSTVVVLAAAAIALATAELQSRFAAYRAWGEVIGTGLSALFLLAIALMNLVIAWAVFVNFRRVRRGGAYDAADFDMLMDGRGLFARLYRPLFRMIRHSWQMFPLGFLFGLGFETATEIGLLSLSASEAARGLPVWSILAFPALFAAGMSLVDTTDGILMLGAYGWAFVKPLRKLYYNLTITLVSAAVALLIGGLEALGLIADRFELEGDFWVAISAVNEHFGVLGYGIIGLFALTWLASRAIWRWQRLDEVEIRIERGP
jgi:high-affinity nickel-transport protein